MIKDKATKVIEKLFKSFVSRYQIGSEISLKSSDFIFDYVDLWYCRCHKINVIRNKKATINCKNHYDKCFQYTVAAALNHGGIEKNN